MDTKDKTLGQPEFDSLMTKEEYDIFVGEERDKDKGRRVSNKPS